MSIIEGNSLYLHPYLHPSSHIYPVVIHESKAIPITATNPPPSQTASAGSLPSPISYLAFGTRKSSPDLLNITFIITASQLRMSHDSFGSFSSTNLFSTPQKLNIWVIMISLLTPDRKTVAAKFLAPDIRMILSKSTLPVHDFSLFSALRF